MLVGESVWEYLFVNDWNTWLVNVCLCKDNVKMVWKAFSCFIFINRVFQCQETLSIQYWVRIQWWASVALHNVDTWLVDEHLQLSAINESILSTVEPSLTDVRVCGFAQVSFLWFYRFCVFALPNDVSVFGAHCCRFLVWVFEVTSFLLCFICEYPLSVYIYFLSFICLRCCSSTFSCLPLLQ